MSTLIISENDAILDDKIIVLFVNCPRGSRRNPSSVTDIGSTLVLKYEEWVEARMPYFHIFSYVSRDGLVRKVSSRVSIVDFLGTDAGVLRGVCVCSGGWYTRCVFVFLWALNSIICSIIGGSVGDWTTCTIKMVIKNTKKYNEKRSIIQKFRRIYSIPRWR